LRKSYEDWFNLRRYMRHLRLIVYIHMPDKPRNRRLRKFRAEFFNLMNHPHAGWRLRTVLHRLGPLQPHVNGLIRPPQRPRSRYSSLCGYPFNSTRTVSLTFQMFDIHVVFIANKFEQVRVGQQVCVLRDYPGLGIGFRIIDGDLNFQVAKIRAPQTFDDV
jgi:hypothetical protein